MCMVAPVYCVNGGRYLIWSCLSLIVGVIHGDLKRIRVTFTHRRRLCRTLSTHLCRTTLCCFLWLLLKTFVLWVVVLQNSNHFSLEPSFPDLFGQSLLWPICPQPKHFTPVFFCTFMTLSAPPCSHTSLHLTYFTLHLQKLSSKNLYLLFQCQQHN